MSNPRLLALAAGGLLAVAACGGAAPGTSQAPGATLAGPGQTVGFVATPVPGGGTSQVCAGAPTFNPLASEQPVLARDLELEALFPAQISGQPAEHLQSVRWFESLCMSNPTGVDQMVQALPAGINPATFTYASASYPLDDGTLSLSAFRTPGGDANVMVQNFNQLVLVIGGTTAEQGGSMSTANIGGKNVSIWTQPDGDKSYLYVRGDTLFGTTDLTDAQGAALFAALP